MGAREETAMKIIQGLRGSGKTTSLIRLAMREGYCIVCPTVEIADNMHHYMLSIQKETKRGIVFPPTTLFGIKAGLMLNATPCRGYVFDDLERALLKITKGTPVIAAVIDSDGE
jgi:hypothetical protein